MLDFKDIQFPCAIAMRANVSDVMGDKTLTYDQMCAQLDALVKDFAAETNKADEQVFTRVMQALKAPKKAAQNNDR